MTTLLKVLGWALRASAAICITYIVVGVARGSANLSTMAQIVESVLWHAAFALSGVQLIGCARRREARAAELAATA